MAFLKKIIAAIWREKYLLGLLIFWVILIAFSASWNLYQNHQEIIERAKIEAHSTFQHTVAYRAWCSSHGGMYAIVNETTQPNPYLQTPLRDLHTREGVKLTLISPFQMKYQVYEKSSQLHIINRSVSLEPLNPNNMPDPWEKKNLRTIENGAKEVFEVSSMNGTSYMRLLRPIIATDRCFRCHEQHDHKIGEPLGATSIAVPMTLYYQSAVNTWWILLITHFFLLVLGSAFVIKFYIGCKKDEKTIKESEEKFRIVSEFAYNFEYWSTEENELIFISPSCERITGYSKKEFLEDPDLIGNIIHPEDKNLFQTHLPDYQCPAHDDIDFRIVTKEGVIRWMAHTCSPIFVNGQFLGRRSSNKDITEKKILMEELLQAQKMESLGQFAGGIAHDFNNVLTSMVMFTHLIQDEVDENAEDIQDHIKHIIISAKLGKNLTANLLSFGQKQLINPKKTYLNDVVENISDIIKTLMPEDITWQFSPAGYQLPIYADPHQIEQILINLCTNARDAMPDGGTLDITTKGIVIDREHTASMGPIQAGNYMLLAVSDSGQGIPENNLSQLCEPFFTTKGKKSGTGLGLSIVARIIRDHNAYMDISSKLNKGTTFKIYFPVLANELPPVNESTLSDQSALLTGSAPTILLADDDELIRKSIELTLGQRGINVLLAEDGAAALRTYLDNRDHIDLAILDVVMPKKNGWQVYEIIKKDQPDFKVIFISGFTDNIITTKVITEENQEFLDKPLDIEMLMDKVWKILKKQ